MSAQTLDWQGNIIILPGINWAKKLDIPISTVFSAIDYDEAGIKGENILKEKYNVIRITPNIYKKDLNDLLRDNLINDLSLEAKHENNKRKVKNAF